jgi:hypothetical protein
MLEKAVAYFKALSLYKSEGTEEIHGNPYHTGFELGTP